MDKLHKLKYTSIEDEDEFLQMILKEKQRENQAPKTTEEFLNLPLPQSYIDRMNNKQNKNIDINKEEEWKKTAP